MWPPTNNELQPTMPVKRRLRGRIRAFGRQGQQEEVVVANYPYLDRDDVLAALSYAAWRVEEVEVPLKAS